MARPLMVRADTLDLQDQGSPSAQDHTKHINKDLEFGDQLLAPHQAQEVRHVALERQEEEKNLQQAWDAAGGDLGTAGTHNEDNDHERDAESSSDDDMMDRISSSPSIDDEDIDFDFVYALHTFIATVEGQANATKGDTMVLLDDSNSYWWLVRLVKDSSIGYLPAEHIETPTERLARLNKHRNVDLSATMLGDTAEPKKHSSKKGFVKRRRAKTVTFGDPSSNIYVEASDRELSSDEEYPDLGDIAQSGVLNDGQETSQSSTEQGSSPMASPDPSTDSSSSHVVSTNTHDSPHSPPISPRLQEKAEGAPLRSRHGTPRNAESFIKDDTIEPRKFTLTPGLLRDGATDGDEVSQEVASPRLDSAESPAAEKESPKEEKPKKDKPKRTFSGLFKSRRKEKEKDRKDHLNETDSRASTDTMRSSNSIQSADASPKPREVERKTSLRGRRLQKAQAPTSAPLTVTKTPQPATTEPEREVIQPAELEGSQVVFGNAPVEEANAVGEKSAPSEPSNDGETWPAAANSSLVETQPPAEAKSFTQQSFMHGTEAVHVNSQYEDIAGDEEDKPAAEPETEEQPAREAVKKPAEQKAVDEAVVEPTTVPSEEPQSALPKLQIPAEAAPTAQTTTDPEETEQPDAVRKDSKSSTVSSRGVSSPSPASTNTTQWSDAGLLAWAEGDNDIRDMLTIIYDPNDIRPDPNHPLVKDLFKEETAKLDALSADLDGLLQKFMTKAAARRVGGVSA